MLYNIVISDPLVSLKWPRQEFPSITLQARVWVLSEEKAVCCRCLLFVSHHAALLLHRTPKSIPRLPIMCAAVTKCRFSTMLFFSILSLLWVHPSQFYWSLACPALFLPGPTHNNSGADRTSCFKDKY